MNDHARLASLELQHSKLKRQVLEAQKNYAPDYVVRQIKKAKLKTKDLIEHYRKTVTKKTH